MTEMRTGGTAQAAETDALILPVFAGEAGLEGGRGQHARCTHGRLYAATREHGHDERRAGSDRADSGA